MFTQDATRSGASFYESPRVAARDLSLEATPSRLPVMLTAVALAASTVARWVYVQAVHNYVIPYGFDYSTVLKPPLFYAAHGLEILCVCGAGLLALSGIRHQLLREYGVRFLLFFLAGALMAVRGYSLDTAASTQIVASTGPFTVIISLLIFVGAQPGNWKLLDKLFLWTAITYSALVCVGILDVQSAGRWESTLALAGFLNALYFPATWLLLRPGSRRSLLSSLRFLPFAVYAVGSIFTQTRLNWVMVVGALVAYAYIERRRRIPIAPKMLLAAGLGLWVALFSAEYLSDTNYVQTMQASAELLVNRLDEDTRSDQMREFFTNVRMSELLLGRGSLATWKWGGMEWTGGTDVGYLSLLFFGGVPLLLTYLAIHVTPAFGALKRPQSEWQRPCAAIALLWALRMFSSSYPGIAVDYYPVLLCIGACLGSTAQPLSMEGARRIGRGA